MDQTIRPDLAAAMSQLGRLGADGRRNRVREQIDERYPELTGAERAERAEAAYRQEMSAQARSQWRRQRRRARRTAA